MIRRPPRSTRVRSSAASDVYKRQGQGYLNGDAESGQSVLRANLPVVEANAAAGDTQAQPHAAGIGMAGGVDAEKGEEDLGQRFHGNTRTVIAVSYTHLRAHETV